MRYFFSYFWESEYFGSNYWAGDLPVPTPEVLPRRVHESTGSAGGYAMAPEFRAPTKKRKRLTEAEELVLFGGILI